MSVEVEEYIEEPLSHNEKYEEDVWELEPDLDDSYSVEKEVTWPQKSKRIPYPSAAFLIKNAAPSHPRKPVPYPLDVEEKYMALCEKKKEYEKKVKNAQIEVNTAEDLLSQQEAKISSMNAWANKTTALQIKQDLSRRVEKTKETLASCKKEFEAIEKSDTSTEKLYHAYIGVKTAYEELIKVRNDGFRNVYGATNPISTVDQIVKYYKPTIGPIEVGDGTTYFEFPEDVTVCTVVRELLLGGHEYVQRCKVWQGLYLDTSALEKFAKKN